MRALLDTHALLWWLIDDPGISKNARGFIEEPANDVLVSAASAWEIATKVRLGKLTEAEGVLQDFAGFLSRARFEELAMTSQHAIRAGLLPGPHRDPFDRMLAAQCEAEDLPIISRDRVFDSYKIRRVW